jgi:ABC-type antimicrobial peptide transport system permease subunit
MKKALIILGIIFGVVLLIGATTQYQKPQIGRYEYIEDNSSLVVFDNATGKMHIHLLEKGEHTKKTIAANYILHDIINQNRIETNIVFRYMYDNFLDELKEEMPKYAKKIDELKGQKQLSVDEVYKYITKEE